MERRQFLRRALLVPAFGFWLRFDARQALAIELDQINGVWRIDFDGSFTGGATLTVTKNKPGPDPGSREIKGKAKLDASPGLSAAANKKKKAKKGSVLAYATGDQVQLVGGKKVGSKNYEAILNGTANPAGTSIAGTYEVYDTTSLPAQLVGSGTFVLAKSS